MVEHQDDERIVLLTDMYKESLDFIEEVLKMHPDIIETDQYIHFMQKLQKFFERSNAIV